MKNAEDFDHTLCCAFLDTIDGEIGQTGEYQLAGTRLAPEFSPLRELLECADAFIDGKRNAAGCDSAVVSLSRCNRKYE
jgi:hypothetical protein